MPNLGFTEIAVIFIVALVFVGPEDLPKLARKLSRFLNEIKRSTQDISNSFMSEVDEVNQKVNSSENEVADPVEDFLSESDHDNEHVIEDHTDVEDYIDGTETSSDYEETPSEEKT